jgi:hypothetical protein
MIRLIDVSALALMLLNASAFAADKLGVFPVDPAQISVAGISSGAFVAMGAAMVAGGLYGCAVQEVESDGVLALASQAVPA